MHLAKMAALPNFLKGNILRSETFEKCSILFKFKASENFNHPDKLHRDKHPYIEYFED